MPRMTDIANDNEPDEEVTTGGDADEGTEKQGKEKQAPATNSAQVEAAISLLTQNVRALTDRVSSQPAAETQQQVSSAELAIQQLLAQGYKPEQLEAVVTLLGATKADIRRELEKEYEKRETQKGGQTLDSQCFDRASETLDRLLDGKEISDRRRQLLISQLQDEMETNADFVSARNAYQNGRAPSLKDFEKAARLVLQEAGEKIAMNTRDNGSSKQTPGLDTRNSTPNAKHPAIGKNGEVDVDKLDPVEREVYQTALNKTKNKEIALHALRTIAPALKR